jgi:hypothetical protein
MRRVRAEVTDRGSHATEDTEGASGCLPPDLRVWRAGAFVPLAAKEKETLPMPEPARLRALEERHAMLEVRIAEEDNRPLPDAEQLRRMKREKLRLKDEMERLRGATVH